MGFSKCPQCNSENIYQDGNLWVCPECSHEWTKSYTVVEALVPTDGDVIKDASGNVLANGDSVVVLKDLKIKGSSGVVKSGTKVKSIRIDDQGDGHNISCKIDGLGSIYLKSEFVRKV